MLKVFIGYDHRQPVSYTVLQHSIFNHATVPVAITPLVLHQLPITRVGLTPFTYSRFLVPYLCNYQGWALFLDIDMIVRDDITKLFELADDKYAVMVANNPDPKLAFERASVMLFNCAKCKVLTPEFIEDKDNTGLHQIKWVDPSEIGTLPHEWNHLVGYDEPSPNAALLHYTQGVPCFPETLDSDYAQDWHAVHKHLNRSAPWAELMGTSVHAAVIDNQLVPKFVAKRRENEPRIITSAR